MILAPSNVMRLSEQERSTSLSRERIVKIMRSEMTNLEAIELLKQTVYLNEEVRDMAIEALEQAEKYKWHSLKDNPNDLPTELKVLCCFKYSEHDKDYTYDTLWYGKVNDYDYPELKGTKAFHFSDDVVIKDVIAWAYIPKFESEEE